MKVHFWRPERQRQLHGNCFVSLHNQKCYVSFTMLAVAPSTMDRHCVPLMDTDGDLEELKLLGRALSALRGRRGISQAAAGEAFGTTPQGWGKYEAGKAPTLFRPGVQAKLTAALGTSVAELMREFRKLASAEALVPPDEWEREASEEAQMLPILEPIRAGNWLEMDAAVQITEAKRYPVGRDPRYRHAEQWLRPVFGDSMNKRGILEGDLVRVISVEGSGHTPETGEIVEVVRSRFQGSEREITLKEIEVTPKGVILWPRSTNERYQKPIDLREGVRQDEQVQVRITGFVTASVRAY